jgi:dolichyl-phosphate beta-glucosyltransferase
MSNPWRLSIVIPAHNEVARLPAALKALAAARTGIEAAGWTIGEVLIAENGSSDATSEVALATGARLGLPLRVAHYPTGKAAALAAAIPETDPACGSILYADADGATDWATLTAMRADGAVYLASRHLPDSRILRPHGDSVLRRTMSVGMRALSGFLFGLGIADTQCGFKLGPATAFQSAFAALRSRSWVFDVELLVRLDRARVDLVEVPCTWTEVHGSKVRPIPDTIESIADLFAMRLRLRGR